MPPPAQDAKLRRTRLLLFSSCSNADNQSGPVYTTGCLKIPLPLRSTCLRHRKVFAHAIPLCCSFVDLKQVLISSMVILLSSVLSEMPVRTTFPSLLNSHTCRLLPIRFLPGSGAPTSNCASLRSSGLPRMLHRFHPRCVANCYSLRPLKVGFSFGRHRGI